MSNIYLEKFQIDQYRSCDKTVLKPNKSLSGLIGINGAGKTNVLNALRLLNPLNYMGASNYKAKKYREELHLPQTLITATFGVGTKRVLFKLRLTIAYANGAEEVVSSTEYWNFREFGKPDEWTEIPSYLVFDDAVRDQALHYMYLFEDKRLRSNSQADSLIKELFSTPAIVRAIRQIYEFRKHITYYSASQFTDPTRCPSSFEIDASGNLERGYNIRKSYHLQFLFDLYTLKEKSQDLYKEYENFVSTKMLGLVSRISWKPVKLSSNTVEMRTGGSIKKLRRYKTLVIPKIQIGSSHITFNQLSEGTFKTLALIFYLMTDNASLLLIEEPEVCVHHGLLRRILSIIKAYSRTRQIVFTTHSDLVLDSLDTENVFVVEMKRSVTNVNALADSAGERGMEALHAYLEESGTLGDYWRSGGFSA